VVHYPEQIENICFLMGYPDDCDIFQYFIPRWLGHLMKLESREFFYKLSVLVNLLINDSISCVSDCRDETALHPVSGVADLIPVFRIRLIPGSLPLVLGRIPEEEQNFPAPHG
jgi:hypothetical protein